MVNIAICGLGNIGKVHLSNLRSLRGCAITGIFDARREVSGPLAEANGVSEYSNLDAMFADDRADAIVVATPSSSHRELTVRALDSGRHVFVEKPLAGTLADAEAIVNAAAASDRLVQVGFCERFNAQYIEARSAVQVGSLGRVRAIYSSRIAPLQLCDPTWELGALDTAVHNLDLILWLMAGRHTRFRAGACSSTRRLPSRTALSPHCDFPMGHWPPITLPGWTIERIPCTNVRDPAC